MGFGYCTVTNTPAVPHMVLNFKSGVLREGTSRRRGGCVCLSGSGGRGAKGGGVALEEPENKCHLLSKQTRHIRRSFSHRGGKVSRCPRNESMKITTPDGQLCFIRPLKVWRTAAGHCPQRADSLPRLLKQAPLGGKVPPAKFCANSHVSYILTDRQTDRRTGGLTGRHTLADAMHKQL